ncbi:MAG: hypothetical protein KJ950_03210 [Proteobacteria bacterium]|nr:hypothetical protein [Pseudomonadota bacterium]MBU1686328.1 hypothetical protein [Pseudomonadota bacterium]
MPRKPKGAQRQITSRNGFGLAGRPYRNKTFPVSGRVYSPGRTGESLWNAHLFHKMGGVLVVVCLVLGLTAGAWMGWQIRHGLKDLSDESVRGNALISERDQLTHTRDQLASRERITLEVEKYGLSAPGPGQIGRPE